ncbi:DeoR/GlpR family DNA-binding transcription regulator [Loigolactobacillus jiayinensis]|uniref:Lactose phosphotransferase system repressor n=1 Tax=Loigolactobacillus jiayinensis TaxID=2486016 RepID=A0ABW1RK45_9LACO|nr:DeoR/GlpR family DNA-binding transcription regulator [Loigolactobacillus jiayinensis]
MLISERQEKILAVVNSQRFTTIAELAALLTVSDMTVRRDLDQLASAEKVTKVRGGVQSVQAVAFNDLSVEQKQDLNLPEKRQIAKTAARYVLSGETIYLGSGTTIALLSDYFEQDYLRITTNSLTVFNVLLKHHPRYEITLIGGNLRQRSGVFIGGITEDTLQRLNFDHALVSADGIANGQLMDVVTEEGRCQGIAMAQSQECIVLADHSKLEHPAFYPFARLQDARYLITDELAADQLAHYQADTEVVMI